MPHPFVLPPSIEIFMGNHLCGDTSFGQKARLFQCPLFFWASAFKALACKHMLFAIVRLAVCKQQVGWEGEISKSVGAREFFFSQRGVQRMSESMMSLVNRAKTLKVVKKQSVIGISHGQV